MSSPAGRRHVGVSPNALVKAGTLGHELKEFALERATHFFTFHEYGLEACADCYLYAYGKEFEDRVFLRVYPEVIGLAEGCPQFRGQAHEFLHF